MENKGTLPSQDGKTAIEISADGKSLEYRGAAEEGFTEVELPSLPGSPNAVERLHARDFGAHVIARVESAMSGNRYLKSGPQLTATQVFRHFIGGAQGVGLVDSRTARHFEELAEAFEDKGGSREFFEEVLKPYLFNLSPTRRGQP